MKQKDAKKFQIDGEQVVYITEGIVGDYFINSVWTVVDYRDVETKTEVKRIVPTELAIQNELDKGKTLVSIEKGRFSLATVTFETSEPKSYKFNTGKEAYKKARELISKYN